MAGKIVFNGTVRTARSGWLPLRIAKAARTSSLATAEDLSLSPKMARLSNVLQARGITAFELPKTWGTYERQQFFTLAAKRSPLRLLAFLENNNFAISEQGPVETALPMDLALSIADSQNDTLSGLNRFFLGKAWRWIKTTALVASPVALSALVTPKIIDLLLEQETFLDPVLTSSNFDYYEYADVPLYLAFTAGFLGLVKLGTKLLPFLAHGAKVLRNYSLIKKIFESNTNSECQTFIDKLPNLTSTQEASLPKKHVDRSIIKDVASMYTRGIAIGEQLVETKRSELSSVEELSGILRRLTTELESREVALQSLLSQKVSFDMELARLESINQGFVSEAQTVLSERDRLKSEVGVLREKNESMATNLSAKYEENQALSDQIKKLLEQINGLSEQIDILIMEREKAQESIRTSLYRNVVTQEGSEILEQEPVSQIVFPEKSLEEYYEEIQFLAEESQGTVFLAREKGSRRKVAIKILKHIGLPSNIAAGQPQEKKDATLARFCREIQILQDSNHPNIVRILDYGRAKNAGKLFIAGSYFCVMEYVEYDLKKVIEKRKAEKNPLSLAEALSLTLQLISGLQHSWKWGVVHRDLKPSNVLLTSNWEVKITDYGIAHIPNKTMTEITNTLGTMPYMSPEQFVAGTKLDCRSDIFSLGVLFYYLLTGEQLFKYSIRDPKVFVSALLLQYGKQPDEIEKKIRDQISVYFAPIIKKMVAFNRNDRYQNYEELLADLMSVVSRLNIPK